MNFQFRHRGCERSDDRFDVDLAYAFDSLRSEIKNRRRRDQSDDQLVCVVKIDLPAPGKIDIFRGAVEKIYRGPVAIKRNAAARFDQIERGVF